MQRMLAILALLSCFLLCAAGSRVYTIFVADMTCRYYAYHLSHKHWDSGPLRLKEHRRAYRLCVMQTFQPSSIDLLTDLFTDATEEGREVYGQLETLYDVAAPHAPILKIFDYGCKPDEPISKITRAHSFIVCSGSNGSTFVRGETGGLFDEVVVLNYTKGKPDVEHIARRMAAFQRNAIPGTTLEDFIAYHNQKLARYPNVLLESTLPTITGTVELCLNKLIKDYSPRVLGADFVTEFGLLYHLNRRSSLVDNDEKMLEELRHFFPKLAVAATLSYVPEPGLNGFEVIPWAPPFHPIDARHPQYMFRWPMHELPYNPWFSATSSFAGIIIPSYSKKSFHICQLGPTKINVSGIYFAMVAKVSIKDPPNTSDRRLLIAHLLRKEYSADVFSPTLKRRYDSIDWYFGGRSLNEYFGQREKEKTVAKSSSRPAAR